jgi:hypothetical protein
MIRATLPVLPTTRPARARAGVGALPVIVLALLLVLALVGMAQKFFGSQITGQTTRLAMGRLAEQLAGSAVEEILHHLRSHANDPADPLFLELRQEIYAGDPGEVSLTVRAPHAQGLASDQPFRGFVLEDLRADLIRQAQFSGLPYEKFGLVRCRARASIRMGLTEKVARTVETWLDVKVVLGSTPRPFDQTTVYIGDGASLDPGRANRRMEDALRALETWSTEKTDFQSQLEARKASLQPPGSAEALLEEYARLSIPRMRESLHSLEEEDVTFFRVQDSVELQELDLPGAVGRHESELDAPDRRLAATRSALQASFEQASVHRDYLAALHDAVTVRTRFLQWLVGFQSTTSEYGGEAHAELASFDRKFELVEWQRKAWHVLREGPEGSVNTQLVTLKRRLGRLNGVIVVENPSETLALEGELGEPWGMLVLVTSGRVRLNNTNRRAGAAELLTVVAQGAMEVEGEVHASLCPRERISFASGAVVKGNLILRSAANLSSFQGRVEHDPRFHSGRTTSSDSSGAFPGYYLVGFGPRPVCREVLR